MNYGRDMIIHFPKVVYLVLIMIAFAGRSKRGELEAADSFKFSSEKENGIPCCGSPLKERSNHIAGSGEDAGLSLAIKTNPSKNRSRSTLNM